MIFVLVKPDCNLLDLNCIPWLLNLILLTRPFCLIGTEFWWWMMKVNFIFPLFVIVLGILSSKLT